MSFFLGGSLFLFSTPGPVGLFILHSLSPLFFAPLVRHALTRTKRDGMCASLWLSRWIMQRWPEWNEIQYFADGEKSRRVRKLLYVGWKCPQSQFFGSRAIFYDQENVSNKSQTHVCNKIWKNLHSRLGKKIDVSGRRIIKLRFANNKESGVRVEAQSTAWAAGEKSLWPEKCSSHFCCMCCHAKKCE